MVRLAGARRTSNFTKPEGRLEYRSVLRRESVLARWFNWPKLANWSGCAGFKAKSGPARASFKPVHVLASLAKVAPIARRRMQTPSADSGCSQRRRTVDGPGKCKRLAPTSIIQGVIHAEMPIEIVCGNCENSFGVEAAWAGLIVECPFCRAAVQVPDEVASYVDSTNDNTATPTETPPASVDRDLVEPLRKTSKNGPSSTRSTSRPNRRPTKSAPPPEPDLADTQPVPSLESISTAPANLLPAVDLVPNTPPTTTPAILPAVPPEPSTEPAPVPAEPPATEIDSFPLPDWTVPPVCPWLLESNTTAEIRVTVRAGLTTINYHGQKMVLRDQPETVNWYGRLTFGMSIVTLAALLTWLYYVYR